MLLLEVSHIHTEQYLSHFYSGLVILNYPKKWECQQVTIPYLTHPKIVLHTKTMCALTSVILTIHSNSTEMSLLAKLPVSIFSITNAWHPE